VTWEEIRHFHQQPAIVAFWRRLLGPLLPWLTPRRRRLLLALGAVVIAVTDPLKEMRSIHKWFGFTPDTAGSVLVIVALLAFVWVWYRAAQRFASLPAFVKRHPQLCLHGCFWVWMIVLWTVTPSNVTVRTTLTGCAVVFPLLLWRVGFMLFTAQRGRMAGTTFADHWFYLWPVWGGSSVPYGKGFDYLTSCEAKDDEALARSQLSGLKLFLLAAMCSVGKDLMDGLVFDENNAYRRALGGLTLGVTGANDMIRMPGDYPIWQYWVSMYCELFRLVLGWGSKGHVVIGFLRLGGFYVFRNTYKPLLAETIVEFWNRYYYYFKELLVNFFFFPTFTRYFKRSPRLRVFAAVFAAAFFGNMYYHVVKATSFMLGDPAKVWADFNPRLAYCFALALGIYISMRREQRRPKGVVRSPARRALAIFGVWTFFAFIHLWARSTMTHAQRFHFLLGLFGLG
jgi:hypothetical protein